MFDRNAIVPRTLNVIVDNRCIARKAQPESVVAMTSRIVVELVPSREDGLKGVMERVASVVEGDVIGFARVICSGSIRHPNA